MGDVEELQTRKNINYIDGTKFPKIDGYTVKLEIDESIKPKQQQFRKIPLALEDKVEDKVKELLKMDIIEVVEHAPSWLLPIVPVLNGEICICVDLRQAMWQLRKDSTPLDP